MRASRADRANVLSPSCLRLRGSFRPRAFHLFIYLFVPRSARLAVRGFGHTVPASMAHLGSAPDRRHRPARDFIWVQDLHNPGTVKLLLNFRSTLSMQLTLLPMFCYI
jgi:hypothetical protein